jgi:hypothetical protein
MKFTKKFLVTLYATTIFGALHVNAMQQLLSRHFDTSISNRLKKIIERNKGLPTQIFDTIYPTDAQQDPARNRTLHITPLETLRKQPTWRFTQFAYGFSATMEKIPKSHIISCSRYNYTDEYQKLIQTFLNQTIMVTEKEYTYGKLLCQQTSGELKPFYSDQRLIIALNQEETQGLGLLLHRPYPLTNQYIGAFGAMQQQKFGKSLLHYMVNYQTSNDRTTITVVTEDFNKPAQQAYEALGFQADNVGSRFYSYSLKNDPRKLFLPPHFNEIIQKYHHKLLILPTKKNEFSIVLPVMNGQQNFPYQLLLISQAQKSQLTEDAQQALGNTPAYFIATLPGLFLRHHVTQVCRIY